MAGEIMGTQTWLKASVPYLVVPDDVVAEQGCLLLNVFWVPGGSPLGCDKKRD
jgi:hypothetical protein